MQLTEHFTLAEMQNSATALRKGLDNTIPEDLVPNAMKVAQSLEIVRAHFNLPIRVLSCYRAPAVNEAVGGSKTSAHRFAFAADFQIDGVPVVEVCRACVEIIPDFDQVIYEFGPEGWCHMGFTGNTPRKQPLTATKQGGKTVYSSGITA